MRSGPSLCYVGRVCGIPRLPLDITQNDRAAAECSPDFDSWTLVVAWESL
jgi:hypothetical protein